MHLSLHYSRVKDIVYGVFIELCCLSKNIFFIHGNDGNCRKIVEEISRLLPAAAVNYNFDKIMVLT